MVRLCEYFFLFDVDVFSYPRFPCQGVLRWRLSEYIV